MTVQEIITRANEGMDEDFPADEIIGWVNDCLDGLNYYKPASSVVSVGTSGGFAIPTDYASDLRVKVGSKFLDQVAPMNEDYQGFYILDGEIFLTSDYEENTSITVVYNKRPARLDYTQPSSSPDIPAQHHPMLVAYAQAMAMAKDDEGERFKQFYALYMEAKVKFDAYTSKEGIELGSGQVQVIR
jgi:hypothetical protein